MDQRPNLAILLHDVSDAVLAPEWTGIDFRCHVAGK